MIDLVHSVKNKIKLNEFNGVFRFESHLSCCIRTPKLIQFGRISVLPKD